VRTPDPDAEPGLQGEPLLSQRRAELGWQRDHVARVEIDLELRKLGAELQPERSACARDRQGGLDGDQRVSPPADLRVGVDGPAQPLLMADERHRRVVEQRRALAHDVPHDEVDAGFVDASEGAAVVGQRHGVLRGGEGVER
jgi:hypothetical protein